MIQTCLKEEELDLNEGFLCIDYVNTLEWRGRSKAIETLIEYENLVAWAKRVKLVTPKVAKQLFERASESRSKTEHTLDEALSFRAVLDNIFSATSAGDLPKPSLIKQFNKTFSKALCHLELVIENEDFTLETNSKHDLLSPILWPIAISAAQLLSSYEIERIGECLDQDGCGYFFYDTSKNHSKKYCGSNCATRAKVRRHRANKQA